MPSAKPKTRRAIGYVRISRDREGETSTDTQQRAIEAYCITRGWTLVDVIVEPGRSAYKSSRKSRPGFRKAMDHVVSGAADAFVVWKVDRAARNTLDLLTFVEELEEHSAEFASVTEQMDTSTPQGEVMLTLVAALAQLESAQKSDRATEWHRHRQRSGAVPAGPAALGYKKPAPNELVPDPKVAPLVEAAAERIAGGASVLSVVKWLNAEGVKITHRGLTTALQSPTMIGMAAVSVDALPRRGGARVLDTAELVEGGWEPILDRETWESVRAVLGGPDRRTNSGNQLKWPLVPIARCYCGAKMRHHVDKWKTKTGTSSMGRLLCTDGQCLNGIGYDAVEEAVSAVVLELLDPDAWNALRANSGSSPEAHAAAVEERLARMWEMVLDGTIEPEEYAEAKARWGSEAATVSEPFDLPDVENIRAAWCDLEPAGRLLVYRAVIKSLVIGQATRRGGRGVDLERLDLKWRV
jgi:DNA invertase Pin-like site-specific DNA recombinase